MSILPHRSSSIFPRPALLCSHSSCVSARPIASRWLLAWISLICLALLPVLARVHPARRCCLVHARFCHCSLAAFAGPSPALSCCARAAVALVLVPLRCSPLLLWRLRQIDMGGRSGESPAHLTSQCTDVSAAARRGGGRLRLCCVCTIRCRVSRDEAAVTGSLRSRQAARHAQAQATADRETQQRCTRREEAPLDAAAPRQQASPPAVDQCETTHRYEAHKQAQYKRSSEKNISRLDPPESEVPCLSLHAIERRNAPQEIKARHALTTPYDHPCSQENAFLPPLLPFPLACCPRCPASPVFPTVPARSAVEARTAADVDPAPQAQESRAAGQT